MSWEGHLRGGIMVTLRAFVYVNHGPQRPEPFADETEEEENTEEEVTTATAAEEEEKETL